MPTGVIIMTRRIVPLAAVVGSMALVTPVMPETAMPSVPDFLDWA